MATSMAGPQRSWLAEVAAPAFEEFVRVERPRLVAIAERILRDRAAAEDVAQNALLAYARKHGLGAAYSASWVRAATVHGAYDLLRGDRRRVTREARDAFLQRSAREHAAHAADPAEVFERDERRATLRAALAVIGKNHAAILALRYGGLSYAETAAALNISIGSVGTRLARAEAALAKELRS